MRGRSTRRSVLAAAILLAPRSPVFAQALLGLPRRRSLSFAVWRNGTQIGRHTLAFQGDATDFQVAIEAQMLVKFGPIPVFNYHHQASETWRDGRFATLESHTTTNGGRQSISARRSADAVSIVRQGKSVLQAAADAHPLTHWNSAVLGGPLFNPQTGALVRVSVARNAGEPLPPAGGRGGEATRYTLSGDADIVDWYDTADTWAALRAKAPDGSFIDYRREA